jgi:tetratricopeptide (TPR) repeat protein
MDASEQPQREMEIFEQALDVADPAERLALLQSACREDAALLARVQALLQAHDAPEGFLPRKSDSQPALVPVSEKPGDRIGRYKLREKIGEGGCGVVYVAEQEEPVRRKVALKVIKLGMDTKSVVARFEAERQALAMMDHPNIAKVLDAGATETGRPYFVMELVRGVKITDYCDQNQLSTRERLELFIKVCQAVQHAHQKGIIHRDLKPSNVLVTVNDGVALPKVIDFGIAKATGGRLTDLTIYTDFHQFIGTPAYMSPEQATMTSLEMDTRSDIYTLGVLLYELLTGHTPFDAKELMASGIDAMRKTIREKEPVRPSTRLATLKGEELTTTAKRRATGTSKLLHQLKGDLDWIVMKCLEKDRTRRYETAHGLAMDLQRHVNEEPVTARPPGKMYRFQKLVRRNKLGFSAAAVVTAALLVGLGVSMWAFFNEQQSRQQAERDKKKAESEAAKSRQVAQFLKDMLIGVGPSVALGRDTTLLREVLDRTAERVGKDLANAPEAETELRLTLANIYDQLGLYQQEQEMARQSLQLARSRLGDSNLTAAQALFILATAQARLGNYDQSEKSIREALAMQRKLLGNEHPDVANSLAHLAMLLKDRGHLAEAENLQRQALAMQRKMLGNEHPDVAASLNNLALVLTVEGQLPAAESLYREALAMQRKMLGNEHPTVANSLSILAQLLYSQGKLVEAEAMYREALAMQRKFLGEEHPLVAQYLGRLANVIYAQGKLADAEALQREVLAMRRKLLGNEHPEVAESLGNLASMLQVQGKLAEAEPMYRESLAMFRKLLGEENQTVASTLGNLAAVLYSQGKLVEAEPAYREALAMQRKVLGLEHPEVAHLLSSLANLLRDRGKLAEAETLQREALAMRKKLLGDEHPDVAQSLNGLATVLNNQGKLAEAETLFREALALQRKLLGEEHPDVAKSLNNLAGVLRSQGKLDEAETLLRQALAIKRKVFGNEHSSVAMSLDGLGVVLNAQGKLPEAETMEREALAMRRKLLGNEHSEVAASLNNLATLLGTQGKLSEAETMGREALAIWRKLLGDEHPNVVTCLNNLVDILIKEGKFDEAEKLFNDLLTPTAETLPNSAGLLRARGDWRARTGHWKEAAADFSKAIELDPQNPEAYRSLAPLLAQLGDLEGYRRHCARVLARFGESKDPLIAARMAKDCLLLPAPGADLTTESNLAETAVSVGKDRQNYLPFFQIVKGLAEYRQGHLPGAIEWTQRALAQTTPDPSRASREVEACMVLAMAQARSRQMDQARATLAKGVEISETKLPKLESGDIGGAWWEWIISQALVQEAKALIEGPSPPELEPAVPK